jgi:hypothetical protein
MSLTKKTMIARLTIEMLGMGGKDKRLTHSINMDLNANQEAGYYHKCKIDRASVSDIIKAAERARKVHRKLTRPFGDDKWRLLPTTRFNEYSKELRAAKVDFFNAVRDLELKWPAVVAKQQRRLQSSKKVMFIPGDYPFCVPDGNGGFTVLPNVNLSKHYIFEFEIEPTPDKDNLIVDLEKETIDELKKEMQTFQEKKLADSKKDLWKRIFEPVKNMADICSNDKKVFKSLIKNIEKEISILRDLNVTNDIDMNQVLDDVEANLTGYTIGQIRDDKKLKSELGQKAEQISHTLDKYLDRAPD